MQGDNPIGWLMFFTLAATVLVIAGAFIFFLRSHTNRKIAVATLEGNGSGLGAVPSGAGPELVGITVLALAIMALLTAGYSSKSRIESAQMLQPAGGGTVGGPTTGMAQPTGSSNQPKPYQPANPAADTRSSPTSSSTGVGNDNGQTEQSK